MKFRTKRDLKTLKRKVLKRKKDIDKVGKGFIGNRDEIVEAVGVLVKKCRIRGKDSFQVSLNILELQEDMYRGEKGGVRRYPVPRTSHCIY